MRSLQCSPGAPLGGGIGEEELTRAGAYRVYCDPAELDKRLYELDIGT